MRSLLLATAASFGGDGHFALARRHSVRHAGLLAPLSGFRSSASPSATQGIRRATAALSFGAGQLHGEPIPRSVRQLRPNQSSSATLASPSVVSVLGARWRLLRRPSARCSTQAPPKLPDSTSCPTLASAVPMLARQCWPPSLTQ